MYSKKNTIPEQAELIYLPRALRSLQSMAETEAEKIQLTLEQMRSSPESFDVRGNNEDGYHLFVAGSARWKVVMDVEEDPPRIYVVEIKKPASGWWSPE